MKRFRKIIFIGPVLQGGVAKGGDTMKNQLFLERFNQVYDEVIIVDTFDWKKHPWLFVRLGWVLLVNRDVPIVVSANPGSADILLEFIHILGLDSNTFYWVVGGSFHKMIEDGRFKIKHYRGIKAILVQGQAMVDSLHKNGLMNAKYVPNSKLINHIPIKCPKTDDVTHFVFLSRIEESKGCKVIFQSIDALNAMGYDGRFDVMFYGKLSDDASFADYFRNSVAKHIEVRYGGMLNLREESNYDILAQYDVMLFPTFWHGEGFPGIVIDAYIASLPIIATDWNLNKDVIKDGETGWIISVHDTIALTERMKYAIDHPDVLADMSLNCGKMALQYDSRKVLSEENLKSIGLL